MEHIETVEVVQPFNPVEGDTIPEFLDRQEALRVQDSKEFGAEGIDDLVDVPDAGPVATQPAEVEVTPTLH